MNDITIKEKHEQQLEIFVKRILAKYLSISDQILFEEKRDSQGTPIGVKEPVVMFINNAGDAGEFPVQCISEVILSLTDTPANLIICNTKSRVSITFKLFLLVKYQGLAAPTLLVLPDDIGTKCLTKYDLTVAQNKTNHYPKETLQIVNNNFVYTEDIPLSSFDALLTSCQLQDPTLQSHVLLKNFTWLIDVDGVGPNGTGIPPSPATTVALSVYEDVLDKIGIDQDITVCGVAEDC